MFLRKHVKRLIVLSLSLGGIASQAFASTTYFCQSAEVDPAVPFTVSVKENKPAHSADITLTFPQGNPSVTHYNQVPFVASDSGSDHVAYEAEGISVVVYPDPAILSTVVIGDAGGTQVGLAMRCHSF